MNKSLEQMQEFLRGLSLRQKALLAGGTVAVGLILWLFVALLDGGKNVVLYSGLKPQDAQSMGARLAAKNIPYEVSADGGSLLVPTEKLDAARLETAAQGLPHNARLGFELFDTPNWAGSDFRSITSALSKENWNARCRHWRKSKRCGCIWSCRASLCLPSRSVWPRRR